MRCQQQRRPVGLPRWECLASRRSLSRALGPAGYRVLLHGDHLDAVKIRPREAADQAAAQAFLARHNSLRAACLGELVHPLDHPALVAESVGGQLLDMLTYVPGRDWQQPIESLLSRGSCRNRCQSGAPVSWDSVSSIRD